ncbi:MAG: cell wall hydrolase [Clostridia bacterium]|nr:cell wall hydrolase [Clostridia bacterium]
MKKYKNLFKKLIIMSLTISVLVVALYISYNYESLEIYNSVLAATKDQSSTSTKKNTDQSSIYNSGDMVDLLARLINGEARGEPYKGQVAVGAVVMNRVKSSEFPDTISGVIYQKGQFSCVTDGQFNKAIDEDSTVYKAAQEALNGADPTNGCLFFYNPKTSKSKWLYTRQTVITIGSHRFAK